jgi:hypothetical protein
MTLWILPALVACSGDTGKTPGTDTQTDTFVDAAPAVEITAPEDGAVYEEGAVVRFAAVVSDDVTSASRLSIAWVSDIDGALDAPSPDSNGDIQFTTTLSPGDHTLTLTVTDSAGQSAAAAVAVNVNGVPTTPAISLSPDPAYTDDALAVTIDTESEDPEGGAVSYEYTWYLGGQPSTASSGASLDASETARGDLWRVAVVAVDSSGLESDPAQASLTIQNSPPEADAATLSPDPAGTDDVITCAVGSTSDADGDEVSLSYAWTVNGSAVSITGDELGSAWFERGDLVACAATPSDDADDGEPVASDTLEIGNTAPSVTTVTITPIAPKAGETLTCSYAGFADSDGDDDSSTFSWAVDGVDVGVSSSTLSGGFTGGAAVTCTVTPSDGTDDGDPVSASVTAINSAPTISTESLVITPSDPTVNDTLTCSYESSQYEDLDGDADASYFTWSVNGVDVATGSTLSTGYVGGDIVTCTVTPSDGTDEGQVIETRVAVANSPPTINADTVVITPDPAYAGDALTCEYEDFSDDDGDDDQSFIVWSWWAPSADPSDPPTGTAEGATLAGDFRRDYTVLCEVTAYDGTDEGNTGSYELTITNSLPEVLSVTLSPSTVYTDDTLKATATVSDADADTGITLEYNWYELSGSGVPSLLTPADPTTPSQLNGDYDDDRDFNRGDELYVEVTASDQDGAGATTTSATVTVQNSTPTTPTVAISPDTPNLEDDLTCGLLTASTDADPYDYNIDWYLDGVLTGFTGFTEIPGSETADGDTWKCTVSATDGTATSGEASDSVVVSDQTAPDVPTLTDPFGYQNELDLTLEGTCEATCSLKFYFTDDDGSWVETDTCGSGGTISHDVTLARGNTTEVYMTCTDSNGNVSEASNTVTVEVCSNGGEHPDLYDEAASNDSSADASDEWETLVDADGTQITITANALTTSDSDWYLIRTSDDSSSESGGDGEDYIFDVQLTDGASVYEFEVYNLDFDSSLSSPMCAGSGAYTEMDFYFDDSSSNTNSNPYETDGYSDTIRWNNGTDCVESYATTFPKTNEDSQWCGGSTCPRFSLDTICPKTDDRSNCDDDYLYLNGSGNCPSDGDLTTYCDAQTLQCEDFGYTWYVKVNRRDSAADSCADYTLQISNGIF